MRRLDIPANIFSMRLGNRCPDPIREPLGTCPVPVLPSRLAGCLAQDSIRQSGKVMGILSILISLTA